MKPPKNNRKPEAAARPRGASPPARRKLPAWKKLLFALIICLGFFALAELLLALAGVRPMLYERDPYVGFSSQIPLFVRDTESGDPHALVTAKNKQRFFNVQKFSAKKPPGAMRIFCLGGSTTYGHPYDDKTSFCGWLRAMLPKTDPSRDWEVINCGGISYASYREALLMEALIRYEPDLFIVLSGHNEFLEQRTYGDLIALPKAVRGAGALLSRTRLHAAAQSVADKLRGHPPATPTGSNALPAEVDTMLDRAVGPQAYARDDEWQRGVIDHYRFNLARMADIARAAGAKIIFVTPASNLRSCSPFKSENRKGLGEADFKRQQGLIKRATSAHAARQWNQILTLADESLVIDGRYADAWFLRGRALWELQRFDEAKAAFVRARDEDVCPLRALTSMGDAMKEVAAPRGLPVVDFIQLLAQFSEHGAAGEDWFLDHVHPTIEGHRRLALALIDTMAAQGLARPVSAWNEVAALEVKRAVESQIDAQAHGAALCTLAKVIAWAGKYEEAYRISRRAVELAPGDAAAQYEAGKNAEHVGRNDEAIPFLRKALELNPNFVEAHGTLGLALASKGALDEAVRHYQQALRLKPDHAEMQCNLGNLLSRQGKTEEAIARFREAVRVTPGYAEAHNNLAWSLKDRGQLDEALAHFREAVRLKPGLVSPALGLAWLLAAHPDAQKRDPREAVRRGERLAELSQFQNWMSLDTLAAAYAAAGRFDDAVRVAEKALEIARTASAEDAPAVAGRLALYQRRLPYFEPTQARTK